MMCDTVNIGAVHPLLRNTGHCGSDQTRACRVDRNGATTYPRSLESTHRSRTLARCVEKVVQPGFLCVGVPYCLCRRQKKQSELVPFHWACKPVSSKITHFGCSWDSLALWLSSAFVSAPPSLDTLSFASRSFWVASMSNFMCFLFVCLNVSRLQVLMYLMIRGWPTKKSVCPCLMRMSVLS